MEIDMKNKIRAAIELLQNGIDVGDEPEAGIMQEAIYILSEAGTDTTISNEKLIEWLVEWLRSDAIPKAVSNGCNQAATIIDSLTAECVKLRAELDEAYDRTK